MSESAEVRSLAQLQNLRERIGNCRAQTIKEAEAAGAEIIKLTRWLEDEAAGYWRQQLAESERWLNECREALMRCQATVRADEKRPCTDERKRVDKALARRNLCEAKLRAARDALVEWQRQIVKLRGRLQNTSDMADADMMVTLNHLDKIIATLEAYTNLRSS